MDAISADVWVLTETRLDLSPGPEFYLVASSTAAPDRGPGEVWVAIWSRYSDAGVINTSDPERTAAASIGGNGIPPAIVYGLVLPWLTDKRRAPLRGFDAFNAALWQQQADWRALRRTFPNDVFVAAGDFNQDLLDYGHYYGSAKGRAALRSAMAAANLECLTAGSRDPVARQWPPLACIDHICVGRSEHTSADSPQVWPNSEQVGRSLTDHFGIATTIRRL